jgi:hypothetical protein
MDAEDRSDRCVHLGVHEHHGLTVPERLEDNLGAELHRPGDVDEDVDVG